MIKAVMSANKDEQQEGPTTNLFITFHRDYGAASFPDSNFTDCVIPMESFGDIAFGDRVFPEPDG